MHCKHFRLDQERLYDDNMKKNKQTNQQTTNIERPANIKQELSIDAMAEIVVMLIRAVEEGKEIVKKEQE